MMLDKGHFVGSKKKRSYTKIDLKFFVDLDCDTVGWYAIGHHDRQKFLAAVATEDPERHLSVDRVVLTWAMIEGDNFEVFDKPVAGSQPITLVEDSQ